MFSNLKIKSLIIFTLSVLGAIMIAVGLTGVYNGNHAAKVLQETSLQDIRSDATINRIKFRMEMMRSQVLLAVQHNPASEYAKMHDHSVDIHLKSIEQSTARINQLWNDYSQMVKLPEEKRLVEEWHNKSGNFGLTSVAAASGAIKAGKWDEAQKIVLTQMNPSYNAGLTAVQALSDYLDKRAAANVEMVAADLKQTFYFMIGTLVIGVLFSIAACALLVRILYGRLGGEPADAAAVVRKIADGDLSTRIDLRADDRQSLLYDMNNMRDRLVGIVRNIRSGTDTITTAAAEIATGNMDLSARTEEQASSLEETASSMEELTSAVRQNADNARQANQLAITASEVAVKGGEVVTQVVDTMSSINESSKKIADIIGVIDGIAFQTNILALNAAVEAARAGEQGRGFAVVATEVRNLAQRSASAAREIKSLIDDSVTRVESGGRLVAQAGATMTEIVGSIQRVTDIMGEITAASREQSEGIEQVNDAITQMDQVTQQNAALVEEAAAAAASMQDQAHELTRTVSAFNLGAGTAGAAPTTPVRAIKDVVKLAPKAKAALKPAAAPALPSTRLAVANGVEDWEEF